MKELYEIAGLSKQALWKYRRGQQQKMAVTEQVIKQINKIRRHHKRMGCRSMYYAATGPLAVGRDIFEQIGFAHGFRSKRKRNMTRTTWSQRVEVYANLIEGKVLDNINQLWQSDIFYLRLEQQHFYGVTIEDVYSRELLSLHLSKRLTAEQVMICFKKALRARQGTHIKGCIFHSDRGSQYISSGHKQLLKENGMKISMGKLPQENAYVERLQGTLKNQYFSELEVTPLNLQSVTGKIIRYYNTERPHSNLNMMTPSAFAVHIGQQSKRQRPKQKIHEGFAITLPKKEVEKVNK
jgi:transposase InsO family protein